MTEEEVPCEGCEVCSICTTCYPGDHTECEEELKKKKDAKAFL